jgi:integrase
VDYSDATGRHVESFSLKRDAVARGSAIKQAIKGGAHTAISTSPTVAEIARLYLQSCVDAGLEPTTLVTYAEHVNKHIVPYIGSVKVAALNAPQVREFADRLRQAGRSPAMVKKALVRLGSILGDAQDRGLVAQNVVRNLNRRGGGRQSEKRARGRLRIGEHIPSPGEITKLIAHLDPRWRPVILVAIFCGLRASELRALRWVDLDLKRGELRVAQRADRLNVIGRPKSAAGERVVPLPPMLINVLKAHKLASPPCELVFPNSRGNVESWKRIAFAGLYPAEIKAGIVTADGKPKYALHALRHFFASWCINRKADGGLELPLKLVQARMGHAAISMTADVYGHLFPRGDDGSELAAAEKLLHA